MTTALFVSPVEVDNPVDGLRWRAHLTARGLSTFADLTVVEITTDGGRQGADVVHTPRTPLRRVMSRWHPRLPARVAARDWRPAVAALAERPGADVVWVMQPDLVGAGVTLPPGPVVVDMVDLEDGKYQDQGFGAQWQRRRWQDLQQGVLDRADAIALAHPGEAATLVHPEVEVLPNAVDVQPVESTPGPPTLTLVGRFTYQPNAEAARWMATEVLPIVRAHQPDVILELVGRHDGSLSELEGTPGVAVVGFVDDLEPVWRQTTALVAPIRSGTGTRLKIIEAFARGVAVVSTTLGCDGLDAIPDEHLLVGDDPEAFAERCRRVIEDSALRARLGAAGRALAERRHGPEVFEATVAALAGRMAAQ